jgi:crotonobetainyl-CoA:carnitine CoA-transferase CaiB-like acyl-CoA transferase
MKDIVVADFSRILAGPLCTMLLGDAGARVIKIESPSGDETRRWGPPFIGGESAYFLSVNRNKESVVLDLRSRAGRDAARRLVARADVVVENFRDHQAKEFGLTSSAVHRANPRAILCSIRGFERDTPLAGLPGYDLLAQASGGLMAITGEEYGEPAKVGVAIADVLTAHYAYGAIVTALLGREGSGKGDAIEVSLYGATVASLVNVAQSHLVTGRDADRHGNAHPSIVPYQTFYAADRTFALAVGSDAQFVSLCRRVIGDRALAADPRFTTNPLRVENRIALVAALAEAFRTRGAGEWVARCRRAGVPASLVESPEEIFAGAGRTLVDTVRHPAIGHLPLVKNPIRSSRTRRSIRRPPPLLGADTERVLRELYAEG